MWMWTMVIPVLSSEHVEQSTMDLLQSRPDFTTVASYDEGAFVFVQEDSTAVGVPADLEAVFVWAREQGHEWLRFDRDGVIVAGLPRYSW